jgi:hypothetical protein
MKASTTFFSLTGLESLIDIIQEYVSNTLPRTSNSTTLATAEINLK